MDNREMSALGGKQKITKFFLKFILSLGFLTWIYFKVEWTKALSYLEKINLWQVALYLIFVFLGIVFSSYKWQILARYKKINLPFWDFFKLYLTGSFINNFVPSVIGGDAYRAYQIGKKEKKYREATATVFIDRISGLFTAIILAIAFGFLSLDVFLKNKALLFVGGAFLFGLVIILLFFLAKIPKNSLREKVVRKCLPEKMSNFLFELHTYSHDRKLLLEAIGLSCLFNIFGIVLANFTLMSALNVELGFWNYLSIIFIVTTISAVPIVGLKEWGYATFFGFFGVDMSLMIIVAIVGRFLQMLLSFLALPLYLKMKKDIH